MTEPLNSVPTPYAYFAARPMQRRSSGHDSHAVAGKGFLEWVRKRLTFAKTSGIL